MWSIIGNLTSPKKFYFFTEQALPAVTIIFLLTMTYGLIAGLIFAPADYLQGDGFRIIYIHAPSAFLSLFIYTIMTGAAIIGLIFRIKLAFSVIKHSISIGAMFTFLALVTGSLWGKPMWGTWWIWDARLTAQLILFFLYLSIYLFQSAIEHKKSAERALAILIIVGFVDIPIIHYSVYWWNTLHQGPSLKIFATSSIDPSMISPLVAMIIAFLSYYAVIIFMRIRYELIVVQQNYHWLKEKR